MESTSSPSILRSQCQLDLNIRWNECIQPHHVRVAEPCPVIIDRDMKPILLSSVKLIPNIDCPLSASIMQHTIALFTRDSFSVMKWPLLCCIGFSAFVSGYLTPCSPGRCVASSRGGHLALLCTSPCHHN